MALTQKEMTGILRVAGYYKNKVLFIVVSNTDAMTDVFTIRKSEMLCKGK